jgi:hypothetical protein
MAGEMKFIKKIVLIAVSNVKNIVVMNYNFFEYIYKHMVSVESDHRAQFSGEISVIKENAEKFNNNVKINFVNYIINQNY